MIYISFILIKPFNELLYPVNGGRVILGETTPIRREMIHHSTKVINQVFVYGAMYGSDVTLTRIKRLL